MATVQIQNKGAHTMSKHNRNTVRKTIPQAHDPHIEGNTVHWHNADGTPSTQTATITKSGWLNIPAYLRGRLGLEPKDTVYVINDDGIAIVISKSCYGYKGCEMEIRTLDRFGNVKLPSKYLHRLTTDENRNITISLPYGHSELVIETFGTAKSA